MAYQSITLNDTTEDFGLQVARGQVEQHTVRHIFGFNPDIDSAAEETVWTPGGLYTSSDTAITMTVSSSSASDTSAGTGARSVQIVGINGDGSEVSEIVTLMAKLQCRPQKPIPTFKALWWCLSGPVATMQALSMLGQVP